MSREILHQYTMGILKSISVQYSARYSGVKFEKNRNLDKHLEKPEKNTSYTFCENMFDTIKLSIVLYCIIKK